MEIISGKTGNIHNSMCEMWGDDGILNIHEMNKNVNVSDSLFYGSNVTFKYGLMKQIPIAEFSAGEMEQFDFL